MICQQLSALPHSAGQLCRAWQWWHVMLGLHPGQGHVRWIVQVAITAVKLCWLMPPCLDFPLLPFYTMVLTASEKVAKSTENLPSVMTGAELDREHINADP